MNSQFTLNSIGLSPDNASTTPVVLVPSSSAVNAVQTSSFEMSESQLEIWLHCQISREANCAFNETATLTIQGSLDTTAFHSALQQTSSRHEMLRATFSEDGQRVLVSENVDFEFQQLDWSDKDASGHCERHTQLISELGNRPFDLANGPLLRGYLIRLSDLEQRFIFSAHHLVLDGWSVFVFCRELGHAYNQLLGLKPSETAAPDLYSQYSHAMSQYEKSELGKQDVEYWAEQFADGVPMLELPTDRPRPKLKTFSSQRCDHRISASNVSVLKKAGAKSGCSLFNFILAGFNAYLARISGQSDLVIGFPTAGQSAMSFPNLIGHGVNAVPFRARVNLADTAAVYTKNVRSRLLDAIDHQRCTFGRVVRKIAPPRDASRPVLFSVMMNIDPAMDESELGFTGLKLQLSVEPRCYENYEWFISGVCNQAGDLELQCQYNSDLFDRATVEGHLEGLEAFLLGMANFPTRTMNELPILSLRQREQIVVQWNCTRAEYPQNATVHAEISDQARRTPEAIALQCGENQFSYHDLQSASNRIARYLADHGVVQGDRVGILLPRSEQMVMSALGIWHAGAAYVPLDPAYPEQRLRMACEDAGLSRILTLSDLSDKLPDFSHLMLELDKDHSKLASYCAEPLPDTSTPSDIAYIIYTSGSTGKPKGVPVAHGSVVNFLHSMKRQPGLSAKDCVLAITTLSFDISVLELYLPLIAGAKVVIADQSSVTDGSKLLSQIRQHQVTVVQATPSTWRMLLDSGWRERLPIRALSGGEAFPRDLLKPMLECCNEVWNMYGPTETTVWSSLHRVESNDYPVPIGRPIANTQMYVLDSQLKEVPVGVAGELYIAGAGVSTGYWNRKDLTQSRFIENPFFNPFAEYVSNRLYRTGDLARWRSDGNLEFLQRNDKQVKVRGHRIELEEIEYRLTEHPGIRQSVVIVREDQTGDARLVAYFVTQSGQTVTASDLRQALRAFLPVYMIPQHFIELGRMPTTDNGKIEYKKLPAPNGTTVVPVAIAPKTKEERLLAQIWSEVLQYPDVKVTDNFFDLGGHSLLVMQVVARVKELTQVKLSPQDFLLGGLEQIAVKIASLSTQPTSLVPKSMELERKELAQTERQVTAEPKIEEEFEDAYELALRSSQAKIDEAASKEPLWKKVSGWWRSN